MTRALPPLRLTVPMVILAYGGLLGALWTQQSIRQAYRRVEASQIEAGRLMAAFVAPQIEAFYRRGEVLRAKSFLNRLNVDRELSRVLLVDSTGRILYSSRFDEETRPLAAGPLTELRRQALDTGRDVLRLEDGRQRLHGAFPVETARPYSAASHRYGVLLMEWDLRFLKELARHEAWSRLFWNLGLLLLLCALAWTGIHGAITRRLHRLIRATERLAAGEPNARSGLAGRDELASVGRALDTMADRLEATQSDLRQRERTFRQLIEHGSDVIALIQSDGAVLFVSPSVYRVLGRRPEDLVGTDFLDFVHPEDRQRADEALAETLTSGTASPPVELRMLHAEGHWVTLEAIGNSPPELAEHGEVVVNARNVSEWKELQDQLRQSQKMKAVGQLAGGIAHDFNNLLTAILGYCELATTELEPASATRKHLDEVRGAAERGGALVRQLLAFSRRQVLQTRDLDLNATVHAMENLLRRTLGERIELVVDLSERPCTVRADRVQLEQVLMNLAINARQAMARGGILEIRTRVVEPKWGSSAARRPAEARRRVHLSVRDTGIGIDEAIKDRIFDPFFTTKPGGEGTGLGLATVHGIVSQSNGRIWVESAPGEGTTFTISLPWTGSGAEGPAEPAEAGADTGPFEHGAGSALVVEDEGPIRALVAITLQRHGYTVCEAESLESAYGALGEIEEPLAVVVSDLVLPDGSGVEIADRVVADREGVAVVLVSGYAQEMVEYGEGEVPYHFLPKPFSADQLMASVQKALSDLAPEERNRERSGPD